ncbi:MAG: ParB/RepB/Spo0J family partition protein [Pseudomonadota bacterium]
MRVERIPIMDIETGARARAVDPARVGAIKASIDEIGLRTPITVYAERTGDDWSFRLVAGAHRLEAQRQRGEDFIDAHVMEGDEDTAALWEIDENFARAELTDAQRADHHVRREAILVRRGEVAAHADTAGRPRKSDNLSKYAVKAAADLGVDERTVRRDLRRGKNIAPEVLAEVAGTELDKGVVLDELASTPLAQQGAKLSEIASRGLRSRVKIADDPLNDAEATERQLAALMAAWNRAGAEARRRFLDRVDEPVFDRGAA